MVCHADVFLVPLFETVVFEPIYSDLVHGKPGMSTAPIGIGNYNTFHGMPDARVNGIPCVYAPDEEEGDEQDTSSGLGDQQDISSGLGSSISSNDSVAGLGSSTSSINWTYFEGKRQIEPKHYKKLISTAITSSFTLRNMNRENGMENYNTLTPTVLINKTKFCVCMYDCEKDLLLLSDEYPLYEIRNRSLFF